MWAPADLFSHALDIFLFPVKRMVSFFYETPLALALAVIGVGVTIALVTLLGGRGSSRG